MPGVYERDIPLKQRQILDKIGETKASSTKFFSALNKGGKLVQLDVHWQLEARDNTGHVGVRDGEDQTEWNRQLRIAAKMRCMEMRESWHVTQKGDEIQTVGEAERKKQKAKALVRLKKQQQARCLSDLGPMEETNDPDTADEFAGVFWWLFNPVSDYFTLPEAYRTPSGCLYSGTLANLHEVTVQNMIAEAFVSRDEDDIVLDGFCGIDLKNRFNDWGAHDTEGNGDDNLRVYSYDGSKKSVMRCVDFLHLSEGMVRLHPTNALLRDRKTGVSHADARRSGVFLDMEQWVYKFMVPMRHKDNTDEGGGPRGFWKSSGMMHPITINGQLGFRCSG